MSSVFGVSTSVYEQIAVTLAHFLWQGLVIALLAFVACSALDRRSSQLRYCVYLVALILMAVCVPATFALVAFTSSVDARFDGASRASYATPRVAPSSDSNGGDAQLNNTSSRQQPALSQRKLATSVLLARSAKEVPIREEWGNLSLYVVGTYSVGVVLMLLRLSASLYGGHRLRKAAAAIEDEELLATIRRVAQSLKMRRVPTVSLSESVAGPVVIGMLRPVVLMPVALSTGLTPSQLQAIVTHELAHLRRCDHLVLVLQKLIEAALFFHPAVWHVSRCLSLERENCCDDTVIAAGTSREGYAELLLRVAEGHFKGAQAMTALAATGERPSSLRQRIARLLDVPAGPAIRLNGRGGLLAVTLLALALLSPSLARLLAQPNTLSETVPPEHERSQFAAAQLAPDSPDDRTPRPTEARHANGQSKGFRRMVRDRLLQARSTDDVERTVATLEAEYSEPSQIGRIRATAASLFYRRYERDLTARWAQRSLQATLSPVDRLRMYQHWSDATREKPFSGSPTMPSLASIAPPILGLIEATRHDARGEVADLQDELHREFMLRMPVRRETRRMIEDHFRTFPLRGLLLNNTKLARPQWLPADVTFYESVHVDLARLFEILPPVVNALADDNVFEDVLESIRLDPNGPGIDVQEDIIGQLGSRVTMLTGYSGPAGEKHGMLIAMEAIDGPTLAATIRKAFVIDPSVRRRVAGAVEVWEGLGDHREVSFAACVAHGNLLLANDPGLLARVLAVQAGALSK